MLLLHLSDIHFNRKFINTVHDPDADVRRQLLRDALTVVDDNGSVDAILVTGDIAFSAKTEEYEYAATWLKSLADNLKCAQDKIFVTPGNHDIDWTAARDEERVRLCAELGKKAPEDVDEALRFYLLDDSSSNALLKPLENYNRFASAFKCDISAAAPFWEKDLTLHDATTLRLRGLNSTWVSGEGDKRGHMIVGQTQAICPEFDGIEYVTLCHHPPEWLLDDDPVLDALHSRARVLLFGHKHNQRYYQLDETLRLTAGAVHPDRREKPWEPRYNFLRLEMAGVGEEKRLRVSVFERLWRRDLRFAPAYTEHGKMFRSFELRVGHSRKEVRPVELPPQPPVLGLIGAVAAERSKNAEATEGMPKAPPAGAGRTLAQRFLRLPPYEQTRIGEVIGVLRPEDAGVPVVERARLIFHRAQEGRLLTRLWEEVARAYRDDPLGPNPFAE